MKRIPALDTLRAGAILWVILHHLNQTARLDGCPLLLRRFCEFGNSGVDLFFVLSGYLITRLLLAESLQTGRLNVPHFWYRRWLRTLPAYYVTLLLLVCLALAQSPPEVWPCLPSYFVFLQHYANGPRTVHFTWSWSLCAEEWFYLLLPLCLVAVRRAPFRPGPQTGLRLVAGAAFLCSLASRAWMHYLMYTGVVGSGWLSWTTHVRGHFRLDGLAAGVFVATLPRPRPTPRLLAALLAALGLLAVLTFAPRPEVVEVQRFALVALVFGVIVFASTGDSAWSRLRLPGAAFVADLSYSLYLTHLIAEKFVTRFCPTLAVWVQIAAFLGLTLVMSLALRYLVEIPFLKLRDHPSRQPAR
jgi:peptidoglycan/LPS O-acetylase OafA/YrhL